jgi:hypothetical protein
MADAGDASAGPACPATLPDPGAIDAGDVCPEDGLVCASVDASGCPRAIVCSSWCGAGCTSSPPRWRRAAGAKAGDACAKAGLACTYDRLDPSDAGAGALAGARRTTTLACDGARFRLVADDACDLAHGGPGPVCAPTPSAEGAPCGWCWSDGGCFVEVAAPCGARKVEARCVAGAWHLASPICP